MIVPPTSMLQITSGLTANKFLFTYSINKIDGNKVIVKVNVVSKESKTGFFTLTARFIFVKFRQTFSTALILNYLDL